jgi:hypothetical protein
MTPLLLIKGKMIYQNGTYEGEFKDNHLFSGKLTQNGNIIEFKDGNLSNKII